MANPTGKHSSNSPESAGSAVSARTSSNKSLDGTVVMCLFRLKATSMSTSVFVSLLKALRERRRCTGGKGHNVTVPAGNATVASG